MSATDRYDHPLASRYASKEMAELFSGEGRFRWVHVRPGSLDDAVTRVLQRLGLLARR